LANRIFGKIESLFVYSNRSVLNSIMYIRNFIASVGYVPNSVFEKFENKTKKWDIKNSEGDFSEEDADGIWSIWKFIFDESISSRRIVDSSISSDSGSIINFMNKVAQKPFIESFSDTYMDRFYTVFRKPPFDYQGYSKLAKFAKKHLSLKGDQISRTNLSMSDREVYSWYKLVPQGSFLGRGDGITFDYLPAVKFDEYAEIWGSKPLSVVSNLVEFEPYVVDGSDALSEMEQQIYKDLKFMIDCTSYLPFTRSGTIELVNGDRRIKKGMCIYLETTNEVFYVTGVVQTYVTSEQTIDRKTVLSVERGMIYDFIDGVPISETRDGFVSGISATDKDIREQAIKASQDAGYSFISGANESTNPEDFEGGGAVSDVIIGLEVDSPAAGNVSYFSIIDTNIDFSRYTEQGYVDKRIVQNWYVNKTLFKFFLEGKQFSEKYKSSKNG